MYTDDLPGSQPARDLTGHFVGNYKIVAKLGEGGHGAVYLAHQTDIGKKVAIKVLHDHLYHDHESVDRFFSEARLVNSIGHPHIVDILDCGTAELDGLPTHYMLMEFLAGCSLRSVLRADGALAPDRAASVAVQICSALAAAHERGIVHRDIKPDNIFLIARGNQLDFVKLLDFGVAKLLDPTVDARRTMTGVVIGTTAYMSPEQHSESREVDERTDIYALGLVLFEMLVGRRPKLAELASAEFVDRLRENCGAGDLAQVVGRCLRFDREQRYQSAAQLKQAIEGLGKLPSSSPQLAAKTASPPVTSPDPALGSKPPVRPSKAVTIQERRKGSDGTAPTRPVSDPLPSTSRDPAAPSVTAAPPRRRGRSIVTALGVVCAAAAVIALVLAKQNRGNPAPANALTPDAAVAQLRPLAAISPQPPPDDGGHTSATTEVDAGRSKTERTVIVESVPSGVRVSIDGKSRGHTPFEYSLGQSDSLTLVLSEPGYRDERVEITPTTEGSIKRRLRRLRGSAARHGQDATTGTARIDAGPHKIGDTVVEPPF